MSAGVLDDGGGKGASGATYSGEREQEERAEEVEGSGRLLGRGVRHRRLSFSLRVETVDHGVDQRRVL